MIIVLLWLSIYRKRDDRNSHFTESAMIETVTCLSFVFVFVAADCAILIFGTIVLLTSSKCFLRIDILLYSLQHCFGCWLIWLLIHLAVESFGCWIIWLLIHLVVDSFGCWIIWLLIHLAVDSFGCWFIWLLIHLAVDSFL